MYKLFGRYIVFFVLFALTACGSSQDENSGPTDEQRHELEQLIDEGRRLRDECRFAEAIETHTRVVVLSKDYDDSLAWIRAYNNLGTDYRRIGSLADAAECHLIALMYVERMGSLTEDSVCRQHVVALNGLGNVYLTLGNLEQADSLIRLGYKGEERLGSLRGQAIALADMGTVKEKQGEIDSAWVYYRLSMQLSEQCGSKQGVAQCHSYFGQLYELTGNLELASQEYDKALSVAGGSGDEWHRQEAILHQARVCIKKGDFRQALTLLTAANETARKMGAIEHRVNIHRLFYLVYDQLGNSQQALKHYIRADELHDSVVDMSRVQQVQSTRLNFERLMIDQERQQSAEILSQEHHMLRYTTVGAITLGLLLVVVIGLLLYVMHIRETRQRITLRMQKMREMFFTNVTHEFRTPLTVIMGLGHQLEDEPIGNEGKVRAAAKMIVRQSNALLVLINQLLDVSKVRSAVGNPKWRHGNVVAFVAMTIENFQQYADSKRIELSFSHSLTSIETDFVPDYMQKIVSNLLSNAIKYTDNYGKVNVTLEQSSGNRLKLQVLDTGRGISEEDLPHLFEPFYQSDDAPTSLGTGIGLSIVKLVVETMGGTVEVESGKGKGSTFTVLLPIVEKEGTPGLSSEDAEQAMPDNVLLPLPVEDELPSGGNQNTCILIVEDNQDIAHYIGSHLEKYHQLIYARSGEEAIDKALEKRPNMVITDLMMPGDINGLQLCQRIRQSETIGNTPIIIITAKTAEADRIKGIEAGADAYLVKPFSSEELMAHVRKLLERQRSIREQFAHLSPTAVEGREQSTSVDDRKFLGKLADVVYRLMAQGKTDVENIAEQMAMSRSQLNRKIMSLTGQNTSSYVMVLRLTRAKRLLKADPQMSIGDVAMKCGFDDVAYFSRIFKQNFDITPSQYRKLV